MTGSKILRILSKGLAPDFPEDLYYLIKKAVAVRTHLERKRKDKDAQLHLYSLRAVFTGGLDITRPNKSFPSTGNTSHLQPLA